MIPTRAQVPSTRTSPASQHVLFNVGDTLFVHDYGAALATGGAVAVAAGGKKPVKHAEPQRALTFPGTFITAHAHRPTNVQDANDLLIGLGNGEVIVTSLRALLVDVGGSAPSAAARKTLPPGSLRFNTDGGGGTGGSTAAARDAPGAATRCHAVVWHPGTGDGFISLHGDGNAYAYDASRDASVDPQFPQLTGDLSAPSVTHGRKCGANPFARWHLSARALTCASFTPNGARVAVSGADGLCRVLDVASWERPALWGGFKSYYGGLDFCAWAADDRYLLAGGEADMVEVWGSAERAVVAWAEGHTSWVVAAAADPAVWPSATAGVTGRAHRDDGDGHDSHDSDGENDTAGVAGGVAGVGPSRGHRERDDGLTDLLEEMEPVEMLRFGSVGQDCQLCMFDMVVEGISGVGASASEAVETPSMPVPGAAPIDAACYAAFDATPLPPPPPPPVPLPLLPPSVASSSTMMPSPAGMIRSASKTMLISMSSIPPSPSKSSRGDLRDMVAVLEECRNVGAVDDGRLESNGSGSGKAGEEGRDAGCGDDGRRESNGSGSGKTGGGGGGGGAGSPQTLHP